MAAARLLGHRKTPGAVRILLSYLPFADSEGVADEVRNSLAALAITGGKADPVLVAALNDPDAVRRGAAGESLCRAKAVGQLPAVRKLLHDSDPLVRLFVALALATNQEKDAIPVLIDLLGQLPPESAWRAEDVLLRLAGEESPAVSLGTDEGTRAQCKQAWMSWWRTHQAHVDLGRLQGAGQTLGYTLLLLLNTGQALEVDSKGKTRWQIEGLQFPLDVQYLPGNHILVAEHSANRVTERNFKGDIVWERKVENPLAAQRLPNGHTFIATPDHLLEVDSVGREVSSIHPAAGEIMKAQKLRNGDIACIVFGVGFVRLDATGKELLSFNVEVRTAGGKIDVLPNGNVLVPEKQRDRVAEYDPTGKVVWEATGISEPIAAVHLPNGNILVTTLHQNRAVEINRNGKEVWEYRSNTCVNRAFRR
jgi:hypothetical protein